MPSVNRNFRASRPDRSGPVCRLPAGTRAASIFSFYVPVCVGAAGRPALIRKNRRLALGWFGRGGATAGLHPATDADASGRPDPQPYEQEHRAGRAGPLTRHEWGCPGTEASAPINRLVQEPEHFCRTPDGTPRPWAAEESGHVPGGGGRVAAVLAQFSPKRDPGPWRELRGRANQAAPASGLALEALNCRFFFSTRHWRSLRFVGGGGAPKRFPGVPRQRRRRRTPFSGLP